METVIDHLLVSYERGALSRREIVGALAMLTTAAGSAAAAPAGFAGSSLNHVSITVSNIERSVEFYGRVFALPPMGPNRTGGYAATCRQEPSNNSPWQPRRRR